MRILFVHEVNYVGKVIYEMHEFPELFAREGHAVSFFHFPEAPSTFKKTLKTTRQRITGRAYPDTTIELITPPTFGGGHLERYLAPLLDLPSLRREIGTGGYDLIVLYAVPTTGWQTVRLARRFGVPVVFRALDVSHMIRRSPFDPLVRMAERFIYRNVDLLSSNNSGLARYCIDVSGRTKPTTVNLPPLDLTHFATPEDTGIRDTLGIGANERVVLYMGSFFPFSGLDALIDGLIPFFRSHDDLRLVLVGGGERDANLRTLAQQSGFGDRISFTGVVPYSVLPKYLAIADVAVNPFVPQLVTNVALPHKVLQYLAAGIPTVSTSLEGLRSVVGEEAGVRWVSAPSEVAGAAVDLAYEAPESRNAVARQGIDFATANFSRKVSLESLKSDIMSKLDLGNML